MKKIKLFFIEFALFVYTNYVVEDLSIYKKWAKPIVRIGWFYRALVTWIFSFVFLPEFFYKRSDTYKIIKAIQNSPEYKAQMAKFASMVNLQM